MELSCAKTTSRREEVYMKSLFDSQKSMPTAITDLTKRFQTMATTVAARPSGPAAPDQKSQQIPTSTTVNGQLILIDGNIPNINTR